MLSNKSFATKLFGLTPPGFETLAMQVFKYQVKNNAIYKQYTEHLGIDYNAINKLSDIPFLPIEFFKKHQVTCRPKDLPAKVFLSSGTTGSNASRHHIYNLDYYHELSTAAFESKYGRLEDCVILGLLPSYLEREGSSLIAMVDHFMKKSSNTKSGFYLRNYGQLVSVADGLKNSTKQIILIGVSFALLDLAEKYKELDFSHVTIMETGGMKGRRKEMVRNDLHDELKKAFNVKAIHSEYGMTELLSQAYSYKDGWFHNPPWMKVVWRDLNDPLEKSIKAGRGGLNIIDLANIDTCCFIETQDMGELNENGEFQVLGRIDNSEIRGCNLLIANG